MVRLAADVTRRRTNDDDDSEPADGYTEDAARRRRGQDCTRCGIIQWTAAAASLLLILNAALQQHSTFMTTSLQLSPPTGPSLPSPPSLPDAILLCASMARAHRVVPGASWGSLPIEGKESWKSLNCDQIITPDVLLDRRAKPADADGVDDSTPVRVVAKGGGGRAVTKGGGGRAPRRWSVPIYTNGLGGYRIFRIPALARATRMLLAFAEARPTVDDHGQIDIVLRRSADGGRTWGPLVVVARGHGETVGNPVPLFLRRENTLLLIYCSNAASITEDAIRAGQGGVGRRVWMTKSLDAGANWTAPVELTHSVKLDHWTWYATGPGGAIALHNGTLVVPATHADGVGSLGTGKDHSHLLISHDRGETWNIGAIAAAQTNEATIAQLPDHSIILNARDVSGVGRRVIQISEDGGSSWGSPRRAPELIEPPPRGCHGSMVSTPTGSTLFFASPSSPTIRGKLTLRRSDDGGKTWPRSLVLWEGPSAYSSIRLLPDGAHLGVLYERGENPGSFFAQQIVFERVSLGDESPLGALTESGAT